MSYRIQTDTSSLPNATELLTKAQFAVDKGEFFTGLRWTDYFSEVQKHAPYVHLAVVVDDQGLHYPFEAYHLQAWMNGGLQIERSLMPETIQKIYLLSADSFNILVNPEALLIGDGEEELDLTSALSIKVDPITVESFKIKGEIEIIKPSLVSDGQTLPEISIDEAKNLAWFDSSNPWLSSAAFRTFERDRNPQTKHQFNQVVEYQRDQARKYSRIYKDVLGDPHIGSDYPSSIDLAYMMGRTLSEEVSPPTNESIAPLTQWLHFAASRNHLLAKDRLNECLADYLATQGLLSGVNDDGDDDDDQDYLEELGGF